MKHYRDLAHEHMHKKLRSYGVGGHTPDNPHPAKHINASVGGETTDGTRTMDGGKSGVKCYKRGGRIEGEKTKHRLDRPKRAAGGPNGGSGVVDPIGEDAAEEFVDRRDAGMKKGGAAKKEAYAKGGSVHGKPKGKSIVNVIVNPQGGAQAAPPPMPPVTPAAPPMPAPPPAGPPPGASPMPPPGMGKPMSPIPGRKTGGRITAGAESGVGRLEKIGAKP